MAAGLLLLAAGTGLKMYGQAKQTQAKVESLMDQAREAEITSRELEERFEINKKQTLKEMQIAGGKVQAAAAKAGVDISSGSPLQLAVNVTKDYLDEVAFMERERDFTLSRLERERISSFRAADDTRKAGMLSQLGNLFMAGSSFAS